MIIIETLSLSDAFKYPYKTPIRALYGLLVFIPILGWLILFGYLVRLVNEFIEGRYEGLIKLEIVDDLKLGFITFLKALPFYIGYFIIISIASYINTSLGSLVSLLLSFFVVPILLVNFFRKQTVESFFEFDLLNVIKDNPGDYIITMLKQYVVSLVFLLLSLIIIGLPGLCFTSSIFVANFYGNYIAQKNTHTLEAQSKSPTAV